MPWVGKGSRKGELGELGELEELEELGFPEDLNDLPIKMVILEGFLVGFHGLDSW